MTLQLFLTFLAVGIMTGGLYGLIALGLNLIFGVSRFINVAHGDLLMLGAYVAVVFSLAVDPRPIFTIPVAIGGVFLIGWLIARFTILPISIDGRVDEKRGLVLTLGLSMALSNIVLAVFGPEYRQLPGTLLSGVIQVGPIFLQGQRLAILLVSVVLTILLYLFLRFTLLGMAVRATAENPAAAQASGIEIRRVQLLVFGLGACLAAAAGVVIAPVTYAFPAMGLQFTMIGFVVVIVGGLGNLWGGLVAGYLIGVAESLSVLILPSGYNAIVGPLVMLLVLIFRPQGLFGQSTRLA